AYESKKLGRNQKLLIVFPCDFALAVKEKVSTFILDKITELLPAIYKPLVLTKRVWIPFTPNSVADAIGDNFKQPSVIVRQIEPDLIPQEIISIPVPTVIAALGALP